MSRPVKELIVKEYQERFAEVDSALVIDIRGISANDNNALRLGLQKQNIHITVIKNTLARKAFAGTPLENLKTALEGPSALAYGAESVVDVARLLVDWAKKVAKLELKGAILDGEYFEGEEGVKRVSKLPTREEALAQTVTLILSPGGKILSAAKGPGGKILGIVKTIEEKLEKGESITKVAS